MSQFWQNLQVRLQPAVPKKGSVCWREVIESFFNGVNTNPLNDHIVEPFDHFLAYSKTQSSLVFMEECRVWGKHALIRPSSKLSISGWNVHMLIKFKSRVSFDSQSVWPIIGGKASFFQVLETFWDQNCPDTKKFPGVLFRWESIHPRPTDFRQQVFSKQRKGEEG